MKTSGFLNPVEIRNLITANTDENAPHFVYFPLHHPPSLPPHLHQKPPLTHPSFMTDHGTIFGHDPASSPPWVRKFGAFAGTTWLRHSKDISETGSASTEPDFGLNGTTLKVVISKDGRGLHHMVVRVDDMVSAVFPVKERCLLAAMMERGAVGGDGGELVGEGGSNQAESSAKDGSTVSTDSEGKEQDTKDRASGDDSESSDQPSSTSSPPKAKLQSQPQLSKLRILELRAEAMAEAFRDEICGPDFKMPAEFK